MKRSIILVLIILLSYKLNLAQVVEKYNLIENYCLYLHPKDTFINNFNRDNDLDFNKFNNSKNYNISICSDTNKSNVILFDTITVEVTDIKCLILDTLILKLNYIDTNIEKNNYFELSLYRIFFCDKATGLKNYIDIYSSASIDYFKNLDNLKIFYAHVSNYKILLWKFHNFLSVKNSPDKIIIEFKDFIAKLF